MTGYVCTFRPGTATTCSSGPHATPWWAVTFPLWQIAAFLGAVLALVLAWGWFTDHYEVAGGRRLGFRLWRRWYGSSSRVCFSADSHLEDPAWFRVLGWCDAGTDVPWVLIDVPGDDEFPACWCPVTDLAPYAVRRLRPWIFRYRWLRIPVLFDYRPLRRPAGYLEADA